MAHTMGHQMIITIEELYVPIPGTKLHAVTDNAMFDCIWDWDDEADLSDIYVKAYGGPGIKPHYVPLAKTSFLYGQIKEVILDMDDNGRPEIDSEYVGSDPNAEHSTHRAIGGRVA